jgi:hypothetical protein
VSLIIHLVGDINIAIINRYFNLNNNNLVIGINIDNTSKQDLILLLIKLSKLLLVLFITISNYIILDLKEEVLTALTASILGLNFESLTLSSISSPSKAKKTKKEKEKKEKGKPNF